MPFRREDTTMSKIEGEKEICIKDGIYFFFASSGRNSCFEVSIFFLHFFRVLALFYLCGPVELITAFMLLSMAPLVEECLNF